MKDDEALATAIEACWAEVGETVSTDTQRVKHLEATVEVLAALRARLRREREAIEEIEAFLHRPDTHDKDKLTFASAKLRALTERAKP